MLDQLEQEAGRDHRNINPSGVRAITTNSARLHALRLAGAAFWRQRYVAFSALTLFGVIWFYGSTLLYGPLVKADRVVRAEFVQSVVASGHVEAPYRVNIGSQITGVVSDIPVSEGQTVTAGDTLIALDDREARAAVIQNEGMVAQAEARVRQMRELTLPAAQEALSQAQATLLNAQQSYDRAKKLANDGYGTKAALDAATKSLDIARAQMRSAEFQIYTSRPGGSDYVMVETQLAQARANLVSAQSRLTYTVIKAPRDGILISREVERGNVVQPSNVLMKLSPTGETQVVVQIDEKNLGLIQLGQNALVSADAFPKGTFAADVVYINPAIDLQRASVEVKLRVREPPAYLRQDMTISVDIETAKRPDALILPAAALREMSSGKPWVMAVQSGRALYQPVTVGLVSAGRAEIRGGVAEGMSIISATAANVKAGARVRPQFVAGQKP